MTLNSPRNASLDALKAAMTLLVIFHHTAITYGAIGGWFYREVEPSATLSSISLILFCATNQAYFMGLFFLLAGYFLPRAVQAKGVSLFLRDRLLRLGLPTLLFGWFLGPLTAAIAEQARGRNAIFSVLLSLWQEGAFIVGPLWFAVALLGFSFAGAACLAMGGAGFWRVRAFPRSAVVAGFVLVWALGSFAVRLVWPVGATVLGMQPAYFVGYALLFAAGMALSGAGALQQLPAGAVTRWRRVAAWSFPAILLLSPLGKALPWLQHDSKGGWNAAALLYAAWEPLIAVGIILSLLHVFERRFATLGLLGQALARRAFAMYVIHAPVLVAVSWAAQGLALPALLKFASVGALASVLCFVLAGGLLRTPLLKRLF